LAETRTGKRFKLELPIRIHHSDSARAHKGLTENLSAAGVFIHANAKFRAGSRVNFEITLPAEFIGSERDVAVQCSGRVVRTEAKKSKGQTKRGVACVIDRYKFVRKNRGKGC
jgi:hypothetical protein